MSGQKEIYNLSLGYFILTIQFLLHITPIEWYLYPFCLSRFTTVNMRLNKRRMKHADSNYKLSFPSILYESVNCRFSSALLISIHVKENRNIVQYCSLIPGRILTF